MRSPRFALRSAALLLLLPLAAGCLNTAPVKSFATAAGQVTGQFRNLVPDFAASCVRQRRYQAAAQGDLAASPESFAEACARFKELEKPLLAANGVLAEYVAALATMADDGFVSFDQEIGGLATGLTATERFEAAQVNAASGLAKFLARAATDGYRRRQMTRAVELANGDVQTLAAALGTIVGEDYVRLLDIEREAIESYYRTKMREHQETEPLAAILVAERREDRLREVAAKRQAAAAYVAALGGIATAHQALYDGREDIDAREVVTEMAVAARTLIPLVDEVEKAF